MREYGFLYRAKVYRVRARTGFLAYRKFCVEWRDRPVAWWKFPD